MQLQKIGGVWVERFTETGFYLNFRRKVAVQRQDHLFEPIEYRQNDNKRRAANKYPQHADARDDIDSVHLFSRKKIPFGYVNGSVQPGLI